jgi:hypothetical protein
MRFSKGDLFHIEMRSGIYQVLDLYKSDNNGNVYYFRKVFDGKLNLKVSKAEFVHEGWMTHISNKTRERLSETLNSVNVQAILNDLTIDRMMQFGVNTRVEIFWCTMDPKSKKRLEKQLNDKTEEYINPFFLRNAIQELHDQGALRIENCLVSPPDGKRLYRVELGRYCDDFDEFGNECFREMRFSEIKMSRREDLL